MSVRILIGDVRDRLKELADESVDCVVTSPPYFGLRDYGMAGQIGLEPTPDAFVAELVSVFTEVRRILKNSGVLWLNLGDSYAGSTTGNTKGGLAALSEKIDGNKRNAENWATVRGDMHGFKRPDVVGKNGLKPKDLIGIPWRVAFALQADGWWLRQDIIWSKPNPMPESVTDRCTKAHEYLFMLTKSARYYFDAGAIAEPVAPSTVERLSQDVESQAGSNRVPGKTNGPMKAVGRASGDVYTAKAFAHPQSEPRGSKKNFGDFATRNRRSVWEVATQPFSEAHFATFPPALIEPCIKAGCPTGGLVLDPFGGAGTTGLVADRLGRNTVLIELNPEYAGIAERRIAGEQGMFKSLEVVAA